MSAEQKMSGDERLKIIVNKIMDRYGRVLNLEEDPFAIIDIILSYGHGLEEEPGGPTVGSRLPPEAVDLPNFLQAITQAITELRQTVEALASDIREIKGRVQP
jgi:hypothetical protein